MLRTLLAAAVIVIAACKKDEVVAAPPPAQVEQPAVAEPPPSAEYLVEINAAPPYIAGKEAVATISITARDGFHVNPDYPVSFKPSPTEGVKYPGDRVQLSDIVKKTPCKDKAEDNCAVDVSLPVTPESAGLAKIEGVLSFSVCSDEKCLTPKQALSLAVDVNAAPAP